jgi:hypothetical protein
LFRKQANCNQDQQVKELNLRNSIFVDITAANCQTYEHYLKQYCRCNVSKLFCASYDNYKKLKNYPQFNAPFCLKLTLSGITNY